MKSAFRTVWSTNKALEQTTYNCLIVVCYLPAFAYDKYTNKQLPISKGIGFPRSCNLLLFFLTLLY